MMTLDKRTRQRLLAHCGQLQDDDCVDPRQTFKTDQGRGQKDHKVRRLCNQVAETLDFVLAGEFGDARLHSLRVVTVEPAPNTSQLSVTVQIDDPASDIGNEEILNLLATVSGRLRFEVAAAISRKHAPRLLFRVIDPPRRGF